MCNLHTSHGSINLEWWTCNNWQNRWILLPGFFSCLLFLQEANHWVGSLLHHCQKIGMDPELVQHMWVLGLSPGSFSSLREFLLNSPFPAFSLSFLTVTFKVLMCLVKYILSICFSWPPGCHSFKIRGTMWWNRRIKQLKNFLCLNRNHSILTFLSCCQICVEICSFSTQCWPMQSYWIYRDKIQSIPWHSSWVFNSLSIKIYLILCVSGILEIPNCSCVCWKLKGCILSASPLAEILTFP